MTSNKYPFRLMRLTLKLTMAQCALLLATEGLAAWTDQDYALFFVMSEGYHKTENRTYSQAVGELGAWLRFYKSLVAKLPEGAIRGQMVTEYEKVIDGYGDLMEGEAK